MIVLSPRCTRVTLNLSQIITARARAERHYINSLIRYLRDTKQMGSAQAKEMQANFTRRKMRASGISNAPYLLGLYPQELN